jgi:hypothetical protein
MAIYACGILAGIASGYLILTTTFGRGGALKDVSVRIWGLKGPLGAFISAWGGVAMLASAPFDDWWHNAYGLDVRIISPPHMVLAAGFFGIEIGTVMLLLAFMNRAQPQLRPSLERLFLYVGGTVLCESLLIKLEWIGRWEQHNAIFYTVVLLGTPAILAALWVASGRRWACTIMTGVYTAFALAANGLDIWDGRGTLIDHSDDVWIHFTGTGFPSPMTTAVVTTGASSGWVGTVGGLVTSMALNLLVLPTLALRYGRFQAEKDFMHLVDV